MKKKETLLILHKVNQYLRHNLSYEKIQIIRCNQVCFSSSNVSSHSYQIS